MSNSHTQVDVGSGDTVHDDEGRVLGIVDRLTDDGFDVAVFPDTCPDCGARKEHIHVAQED